MQNTFYNRNYFDPREEEATQEELKAIAHNAISLLVLTVGGLALIAIFFF